MRSAPEPVDATLAASLRKEHPEMSWTEKPRLGARMLQTCLRLLGLRAERVGREVLVGRQNVGSLERETHLLTMAAREHLRALLDLLEADCVIDVGANAGQYARALRRLGYAGRIISFEPNPAHHQALAAASAEDALWSVRHEALGRSDETLEFRVAQYDLLSSFLGESANAKTVFGESAATAKVVRVPVRRLDGLWDSLFPSGAAPRVFLKMDTQGWDLNVFAGVGPRIAHVVGLQSEVALVPLYVGMPDALEALRVYRESGFEVAGMFPVTTLPERHVVVEYDCTLVRRAAPVPPASAPHSSSEELSIAGRDGEPIFVRRWTPVGRRAKAAVQIAHGAAEHGARYERLGQFLASAGYAVYADDHRGHGRTAGAQERRGLAGRPGARVWEAMLDDLGAVAEHIRSEHPGAPLFFLGHSMGSLLAQHVAQRWGDALRGLVLSGTFGVIEDLEARIAQMEPLAAAHADAPNEAFQAMFAAFNEPHASAGAGLTGFEWLSRDTAEVQRYVDDPWCGFPFSNAMAAAVLIAAREAWRPENERRIPRTLPVLVICGAEDSAGGHTAAVTPLVERYRALGIADLTARFYPGARHELLNETNRDEVQRDLLAWLDARAGDAT